MFRQRATVCCLIGAGIPIRARVLARGAGLLCIDNSARTADPTSLARRAERHGGLFAFQVQATSRGCLGTMPT